MSKNINQKNLNGSFGKPKKRTLEEKIEMAKKRMRVQSEEALKQKSSENEKQYQGRQKSYTEGAETSMKMRTRTDNGSNTGRESNKTYSNGNTDGILGLNDVKLHPLFADLQDDEDLGNASNKDSKAKETKISTENHGLNSTKSGTNIVNPYFDPTDIFIDKSKRRTRGLVFNEKGKFIEIANKFRENEKKERLQREEIQRKEKLGLIADDSINESKYKEDTYVPKMEWWDKQVFPNGLKYEDFLNDEQKRQRVLNNEDVIHKYVQHPVVLQAPWERNFVDQKGMYLTKKEAKRMRKNRRTEAQREKQDKIKLGLEPPPPPKVKLSNLMNVLTNEAIKDPTAVEMKVRRDIEERKMKHMENNEVRRLDALQHRDERRQGKIERDIEEKGIYCAIFRISNDLSNGKNNQHIYKLDINARQMKLNGVCVIPLNQANADTGVLFSMVVVEGSINSISKYKHLLMSRIKWQEETEGVEEEAVEMQENHDGEMIVDESAREYHTMNNPANKCELVWEGQVLNMSFHKWSLHKLVSENDIMSFLQAYNCVNYWIACKTNKS